MSTSYKWAHPKGLNSFRGQIGELLARKFLEKEGFRVISYEFLVAYNPSWDFWGSMKENFVEWNEALNKIYAGSVHRSRRFDFVARKGEKYYG